VGEIVARCLLAVRVLSLIIIIIIIFFFFLEARAASSWRFFVTEGEEG
jgi:hypothetical protein